MKQVALAAIIATVILGVLTGCNVKEKLEKHNKAKANADFIMDNLDKPEVINQFPEKFFPRDRIKPVLDTLTKNCDLGSKRGKFVDFFSMNNNGESQVAYIYEYILKCDSLRFIYVYDLESSTPELFNFKLEGLEQESKMIIDPSKQLLYSPTK